MRKGMYGFREESDELRKRLYGLYQAFACTGRTIMTGTGTQPLQAWTCVKCGAALPAEAGTGELVTCGYCGTPFSLPTAKVRCGGVNISGGSVFVGGDVIGRNLIITTSDVALPFETIWDESDTSDDEGVSIDAEDIRVSGNVIGGSVVRIAPVTAVQMGLDLDLAGDEKLATPERVVEPMKPIAPETPAVAAQKLGWWEKVKRLFAN
jgi:hypothetical protein